MPSCISLSLVSHTNTGKTTLARTLLARDIGEVRDEAHVTDEAQSFELVRTDQGDRLMLWDTPGFGDSHRLASRLAQAGNPVGWVLGQVWDRFRDRAMWSSQQAVRNVREQADVVLYLVNAIEDPAEAAYVAPEMRILDWIGKPVIVLLNQTGRPRPPELELAEIERWQTASASCASVRAVIQLDAFARCWVQESHLLAEVAPLLAPDKRIAFERLRKQWTQERFERFRQSMSELARRVARAACDHEPVPGGGLGERIRDLGSLIGLRSDAAPGPRERAMKALAQRLDQDVRESVDRLIAIHQLEGQASAIVMQRLADHFALRSPLSEGKAAVWGGVVTGALAGLKADLLSGGLTLGGGLIAGGVLGALGGVGLARGYNLVRGNDGARVTWADTVIEDLVVAALLSYLAVAHYGRGRGRWSASEHPPHWEDSIRALLKNPSARLPELIAQRAETDTGQMLATRISPALESLGLGTLSRLYPGAVGTTQATDTVDADQART